MKIIKSVSLNNSKYFNSKILGNKPRIFKKSEVSVLKVLEKIGLTTVNEFNGTVTSTFGRESGNIKLVFIKEIPMSRDQIRTISNCFPKYINNSVTLKGSIITYIFRTEKGIVSLMECINHGIGGKLIGFVTID